MIWRQKRYFHYNFSTIKYSYTGDTVCRSHPLRSKNARPLSAVSTPAPLAAVSPTVARSIVVAVRCSLCAIALQQPRSAARWREVRAARESKKLPSFFTEPLHPRGAASFFRSQHCQKLWEIRNYSFEFFLITPFLTIPWSSKIKPYKINSKWIIRKFASDVKILNKLLAMRSYGVLILFIKNVKKKNLGTIHLGHRTIFTIFDPYPFCQELNQYSQQQQQWPPDLNLLFQENDLQLQPMHKQIMLQQKQLLLFRSYIQPILYTFLQ